MQSEYSSERWCVSNKGKGKGSAGAWCVCNARNAPCAFSARPLQKRCKYVVKEERKAEKRLKKGWQPGAERVCGDREVLVRISSYQRVLCA